KEELRKANFTAKAKETLIIKNKLTFNRGIITKYDNRLILLCQRAKARIKKDNSNYRNQRALAAYIASLCQLKAIFDLLVAMQV
ncbi:hypothetical protein BUE80_DR000280, partial [Diplocarpon rosae]